MRPTIAHRKIQGEGGDWTPQVRTLASLDKEFAGAPDKANPIEPERALAAGVLRQAANDLRRFRESEDAIGREMYWDARSWFLSNDTEWPYSFLNACSSLGISPERHSRRGVRRCAIRVAVALATCCPSNGNSVRRIALDSVFVSSPQRTRSPSLIKMPSQNILLKLWQGLIRRSAPAHDPLLSLSMTLFNFASGWDRLLQNQRQFMA